MSEPSGRSRDRAPDEFHRLLPLFGDLARLDGHDPERRRRRDLLITGHLPVVADIVHRYAEPGVAHTDLLEVGVAALIHAIDRFDPDGGDFLESAVPAIVGEVQRYVRDSLWPKRTPAPEAGAAVNRPPLPADVASRLGVGEAHVAEIVAAWEAAPHAGEPGDE